MPSFTIGDVTGNADLTVTGSPELDALDLKSLKALPDETTKFVSSLTTANIRDTSFGKAEFGGIFANPAIPINAATSLTLKAGAKCVLQRHTTNNTPLLGADPSVPQVAIGPDDFWMSFGLTGTLDLSAAVTLGNGLGVAVGASTASTVTTYTRVSTGGVPMPSLREAITAGMANFGLLRSAADLRAQKTGTVRSSAVAGTVKITGSYSVPVAVNQLALAESQLPLANTLTINPGLSAVVSGSMALTSDFAVHSWRRSDTEAVLALVRKHGSTLTAKFSAVAGVAANLGGNDLVAAIFGAIAPKANLAQAGLTPTDAGYDAMKDTLSAGLSRAFDVAINAACSASSGDQAAFVYSIDLSQNATATDASLLAALNGDWSLLANLSNAHELTNVVKHTRETRYSFNVNLLGLFNYSSTEAFLASSTVVHDGQDGSVTITDKATASRIATSSTPNRADPDKLRSLLYKSVLATAAYKLAGGQFTPDFTITQSLRIYQAQMSASALKKNLALAVALGEMTQDQLDNMQPGDPVHVIVTAAQSLDRARMERLFFSDPATRTGHDVDDLVAQGRKTLASLLDPTDPVDQRRIKVLTNNRTWAAMSQNGTAPVNSPASYSDWYDITFWANAVCDAAAPLKAVLTAVDKIPAGTDPSTNAGFTAKRDKLKKAMSKVTSNTQAAFDPAWPIAITHLVAGGDHDTTMTAAWNGATVVPAQPTVRTRAAGNG